MPLAFLIKYNIFFFTQVQDFPFIFINLLLRDVLFTTDGKGEQIIR